jgi:uncharacterized damage-inducible protein DinB
MRQINWTERTFSFDFPPGVYPGVVERLRGTPVRIAALVENVPQERLISRPGGAWSVNQHIGHLDDLDALDRTRLAEFLRGAETLSAADMTNRKTHEAGYNSMPVEELLQQFREHRGALVEQLDSLDMQDVKRTAVHPRLQVMMRLVDWLYFVAEHDDHHVARIHELLRGDA